MSNPFRCALTSSRRRTAQSSAYLFCAFSVCLRVHAARMLCAGAMKWYGFQGIVGCMKHNGYDCGSALCGDAVFALSGLRSRQVSINVVCRRFCEGIPRDLVLCAFCVHANSNRYLGFRLLCMSWATKTFKL